MCAYQQRRTPRQVKQLSSGSAKKFQTENEDNTDQDILNGLSQQWSQTNEQSDSIPYKRIYQEKNQNPSDYGSHDRSLQSESEYLAKNSKRQRSPHEQPSQERRQNNYQNTQEKSDFQSSYYQERQSMRSKSPKQQDTRQESNRYNDTDYKTPKQQYEKDTSYTSVEPTTPQVDLSKTPNVRVKFYSQKKEQRSATTPTKLLSTLYQEKTSLYYNTVRILSQQFIELFRKHINILSHNDEIYQQERKRQYLVEKDTKNMDKVLEKLWNVKNTSSMEEFSKLNIDECAWLDKKYKQFEKYFSEAQEQSLLTSCDILKIEKDELNFNYAGNLMATMKLLKKRLMILEQSSQKYNEMDHYQVQDRRLMEESKKIVAVLHGCDNFLNDYELTLQKLEYVTFELHAEFIHGIHKDLKNYHKLLLPLHQSIYTVNRVQQLRAEKMMVMKRKIERVFQKLKTQHQNETDERDFLLQYQGKMRRWSQVLEMITSQCRDIETKYKPVYFKPLCQKLVRNVGNENSQLINRLKTLNNVLEFITTLQKLEKNIRIGINQSKSFFQNSQIILQKQEQIQIYKQELNECGKHIILFQDFKRRLTEYQNIPQLQEFSSRIGKSMDEINFELNQCFSLQDQFKKKLEPKPIDYRHYENLARQKGTNLLTELITAALQTQIKKTVQKQIFIYDFYEKVSPLQIEFFDEQMMTRLDVELNKAVKQRQDILMKRMNQNNSKQLPQQQPNMQNDSQRLTELDIALVNFDLLKLVYDNRNFLNLNHITGKLQKLFDIHNTDFQQINGLLQKMGNHRKAMQNLLQRQRQKLNPKGLKQVQQRDQIQNDLQQVIKSVLGLVIKFQQIKRKYQRIGNRIILFDNTYFDYIRSIVDLYESNNITRILTISKVIPQKAKQAFGQIEAQLKNRILQDLNFDKFALKEMAINISFIFNVNKEMKQLIISQNQLLNTKTEDEKEKNKILDQVLNKLKQKQKVLQRLHHSKQILFQIKLKRQINEIFNVQKLDIIIKNFENQSFKDKENILGFSLKQISTGQFRLSSLQIGRNKSILPIEKQKEIDLFKKDLIRFLTQKLDQQQNVTLLKTSTLDRQRMSQMNFGTKRNQMKQSQNQNQPPPLKQNLRQSQNPGSFKQDLKGQNQQNQNGRNSQQVIIPPKQQQGMRNSQNNMSPHQQQMTHSQNVRPQPQNQGQQSKNMRGSQQTPPQNIRNSQNISSKQRGGNIIIEKEENNMKLDNMRGSNNIPPQQQQSQNIRNSQNNLQQKQGGQQSYPQQKQNMRVSQNQDPQQNLKVQQQQQQFPQEKRQIPQKSMQIKEVNDPTSPNFKQNMRQSQPQGFGINNLNQQQYPNQSPQKKGNFQTPNQVPKQKVSKYEDEYL